MHTVGIAVQRCESDLAPLFSVSLIRSGDELCLATARLCAALCRRIAIPRCLQCGALNRGRVAGSETKHVIYPSICAE